MSALLFVCPMSGGEISTGIEIDPVSFHQGLPPLVHNLFNVGARLADETTGEGLERAAP
jgi:hypothetical protein